eukprot:Sdes_comp19962_c0_seq1m12505
MIGVKAKTSSNEIRRPSFSGSNSLVIFSISAKVGFSPNFTGFLSGVSPIYINHSQKTHLKLSSRFPNHCSQFFRRLSCRKEKIFHVALSTTISQKLGLGGLNRGMCEF